MTSEKQPVRKTISLHSQTSFEFDATKLLDLITADDANVPGKDVKLTKSSLRKVTSDLKLSEEELDIIFDALDSDDDGIIWTSQLRRKVQEGQHVLFERCPDELELLTDLSEDLSLLQSDSQEQVCELYQQLHRAGNPDLLAVFESVILGVLKDIRQYQVENERLEKSFKREKEQHELHMRQMEEEMDLQMQRVEERVRKADKRHEQHMRQMEEEMDLQMHRVEERVRKAHELHMRQKEEEVNLQMQRVEEREQEKTENEKAAVRDKVQEEINMLQQNLKRLQQEGPDARNKEIEEQLIHLKGQVEEMTFVNRKLRSELTDAQTNLALMKSDHATLKQQMNEKMHEIEVEKDTIAEYQREQENLTRQLHLLHDANKRLHDTNDDLREGIETIRRTSPMRQQSIASNASTIRSTAAGEYRRGSLMSEYFLSTPIISKHQAIRSRMGSTTSLAEEPGPSNHVTVQHLVSGSGHNVAVASGKLPRQETCESDVGFMEDIDSGHSTLKEGGENDLDNDAFLNDAETMQRVLAGKRNRRIRTANHPPLTEDADSHDEFETESEAPLDYTDSKVYRNLQDARRLGSVSSRSSSRSSRSREGSLGRNNRRQSTLMADSISKPSSKVPERMFKVVLAGDAAVGKSSLIMRLCKGKFFESLSSTLGVDFQTKLIELDGRTIALQLWDTAGQERFRSIAKSYFRRADGVLLLYDVTYERSFLSIREWMESIEDGSIKKLPIMLCGNKVDMRDDAEQEGKRVVPTEDGQRLAREYQALFIETSAKDGSNVGESVAELTRLMQANEDLEVKTSGLQLHDKTVQKGGCCGR